RVGLAVEGEHRLAGLGRAHGWIARDLLRIEDMQRPAEIVGHEIGDVDQSRYRPKANRSEAVLQPLRARPVLHALEIAARDIGATAGRTRIDAPLDRALEATGDMLRREGLQGAETGRREIARDAAHAKAIGTVRRHLDLDDRVVELAIFDEAHADRRVIRQFDDAVMILAQA